MKKSISGFFAKVPDNRKLFFWLMPLLIGLAFAVYALVYATGGIKYVYSHSMYFPILLAGYLFGMGGGALIGLLGSILLGPFMPIDTLTQEPQATVNWLYRGIFFVSVGMLTGYGTTQLRNRIKEIDYLARYDRETGLPNRTSTIEYISKMLRHSSGQAGKQHMLLRVSCDNLTEIEVAFGFAAADSIIREMQQRLRRALPDSAFLSRAHRSEFAVVLDTVSRSDADLLVRELIETLKPACSYRSIPLHVESTIGCAVLGNGDRDADHLLQMAEFRGHNT